MNQDNVASIILPAEEILKNAKQAPEARVKAKRRKRKKEKRKREEAK